MYVYRFIILKIAKKPSHGLLMTINTFNDGLVVVHCLPNINDLGYFITLNIQLTYGLM
jgi:hypothetical protein